MNVKVSLRLDYLIIYFMLQSFMNVTNSQFNHHSIVPMQVLTVQNTTTYNTQHNSGLRILKDSYFWGTMSGMMSLGFTLEDSPSVEFF